ncbi:2-dehydropantoate 2-reductase (Ketopantoate reductase) (KPA reductase) (KPR) [Teratosphaeriaceae sp. CCFEE 6253]|nr:2-dehydropantoate 2-reductase (Ketopantoate reductase) (KPA reductase) (KPR) [Teratosphaeriaceae sp. CCFEE 6253]
MEAKASMDDGVPRAPSNADTPVADRGGDESEGDTARMRSSLSAVDRQYSAQSDIPRRIHILGTGSIGKMIAHSLRGIADPPPVTLILHKIGLLHAWEKGKQEITIQDGDFKIGRGGFDVELAPQVRRRHGVEMQAQTPDLYDVAGDTMRPHDVAESMKTQAQGSKERAASPRRSSRDGTDEGQAQPSTPFRHFYQTTGKGDYAFSTEPIHNLILTTKAAYTVAALLPLRHRLSRASTICFLQNGMGTIDEVNEKVFPNEETRPSYVQGILTHGVNVPPEVAKRDPFFAVHAGHGTIALGVLPRKPLVNEDGADDASEKDIWAPTARYLLRTLTRTPVLCAVGFTPTELLQQQLEKLAVNSVLNPLTSLLDARNGTLLYNFALTRTLRLLLAETSLVFRSLPELQSIPNINTRFSPERLEMLVVKVADQTRDNISSMLADVRAGRQTEIEYINGYIVRRGEEIGVSCVVNYAIMQTVLGKAVLTQREVSDEVPLAK